MIKHFLTSFVYLHIGLLLFQHHWNVFVGTFGNLFALELSDYILR